jgi:signal transduction histidine kinase
MLRNLKYRQKVLLILALVFTVISAGLLVIYRIEQTGLLKRHRLELEERSLLAENALDLRAREMTKLITGFQMNRSLIEYLYITSVLGAESTPLAEQLKPVYNTLAVDMVMLYNADGAPVIHFDKKGAMVPEPLLEHFPGFPEDTVNGYAEEGGGVVMAGAGPLYYLNKIVGYIEIGKYMDCDYLKELKMMTGGELALVNGKDIISSTLPPDRMAFAGPEGSFSYNSTGYSYAERELKDLTGKPLGRLVIGISDQDLTESLRKLRTYMFIVVAGSMAIALGLGTLLIKALVNPISGMAGIVQSIGEGRFGRKLEVRGRDEIALLSGRFNLMQEQLKDQHEKLKNYTDNLERLVDERTQELRRVERQLVQSQKMESLGALAGGIAHDFNNLLSAILGYASFAKETLEQGNPQYRYWDIVEKAAARGAELTSHLLTFSKGRSEPGTQENIGMNRLITDLSKLLEKSFDKNIEIKLKMYPEELYIFGEGTSIYQALLNICINARDAMPEGGSLIIETSPFPPSDPFRRMHPSCPEGPLVKVEISDTGTGIKKDHIDRIFEPFFSTKETGKGTGLGLAIVYGIIRNHGGFIDVYSEEGRGSTFKIYLPEAAAPEKVREEKPFEQAISARKGEAILVVDDEEPVRSLYQEVLESANYIVFAAASGEEAIKLYREHKDIISLAVLDLILPGMSGHEIFRALKEIKPELKVIVSSGYSPELGLKWMDKEIDGFVQKPFVPTQLLKQIKQLLG